MEKTDVDPRYQLEEKWEVLSPAERIKHFCELPRAQAEDFFFELSQSDQAEILRMLSPGDRRSWIRLLEPDDVADLIQETAAEEHEELLNLLDTTTRNEVNALLLYAEDVAGGLMNPRFARLRQEMTVGEAISYLQRQSREQAELISYAYVIDAEQRLVGMVSFRDLCAAESTNKVQDVMVTQVITVSDQMDQEEIGRLFREHNLMAVPVVDDNGRMKGIVTIDDIVYVVEEEATEDIQKLGGTEALSAPYLRVGFFELVGKRGIWLTVLFVGEMLTATAMAYFEKEIARAVVLAVFVPLIISSGGNAGSQASTLVIRAIALGEVKLRDWWRVVGREILVGIALGFILGVIGFGRVIAWQAFFGTYGAAYIQLGFTIAVSLIGVVMWGTIAGSLLPFILKRCGTDPATASTPFVATLVDVTGLVIYFTSASIFLRGTLL